MTADERLLAIANDLVAEAFCADWHDDPYMGVREVERIKSLFHAYPVDTHTYPC